ncbi:MAG TPA: AAA family ATPase [Sedimentisphaerales bacterium]|nr:AAA family ATPase [Sedimentisphaerales bacterium]
MTTDQEQLRQDRAALARELEQAGAEIRGSAVRCPWHDDRHASGSVWQDVEGVWRYKCHVCGAGGDVFDLRAKNSGRAVGDVLKGDRQATERVFATRGDLRLAVARGGQIESEHDYDGLLVFRLRTANDKAFRQAHPVRGGWIMRAGPKPWPLYNRVAIAEAEQVVVVEGEKKADALIALGICATTSPCGAGKAAHADWRPLAGKQVVLWPDNDEPGRLHMKTVAGLLSKLDPKPVVSTIEPNDLDLATKEDAYDFIEQCRVAGTEPRQAVVSAIERAKPTGPVAEYEKRLRRIEAGELVCLPLPWSELARLTRLGAPGRLTVIAGRQGAAKSFFALQLLRYWLGEDIPASAYLLEGDTGDLMDRTLAQASGTADVTDLDWQKVNAERMRELTDTYREELDRVAAASIVSAGLGLETLDDIAAWIEAEAKAGRRAIIIDPVSAAVRKGQPWVADPAFVRRAKRAAIDYECSVVLVSHLVKGADEGTPDKVAGSAAYGRFSDCVLQIMRHDKKASTVKTPVGKMEIEHGQTIYIEKARAPGTGLRLAYDLTSGLTFQEFGVIVGGKQK